MAVIVGLFCSAVSLLVGFTAINIQRHAQRRKNPCQVLNLCGVLLNLVVGPIDMTAYSLAPQSLLAPFGMLGLVLNLVAGPKLHEETVSRSDTLATLLIVLGSVICLTYGEHGAHDSEGSAIAGGAAPSDSAMFHYVSIVGAISVALGVLLARLRQAGGHADAVANAVLAGVLGSTTVVAGKGIGEAVASGSWFRIVGSLLPLLVLAPLHLYVLNRGMGRHSTVVFVPLNAAAGLLANIFSGFLLYGESPDSAVHFGAGAALMVGGVLCMSAARHAAGGGPATPRDAAGAGAGPRAAKLPV